MKNSSVVEKQTMRHVVLTVGVAVLAVAFLVARPQRAQADQVTVPPVPADIQVPAGHVAFLVGHAVGTQNYVCLPSGAGYAFRLFTPQATLFTPQAPPFAENGRQIATHYFSPNPSEGGTIRPTWQDSRDTSTVWGRVEPGDSSSDPNFVAPGAIAWLLITVVGATDEPTGSDTLAQTTFIQRLNTSGGVAPSTGCASSADIGNQAWVPYTADYYFYRAAHGR